MKLGILADIHEDVQGLARGLALLRREAVDRVVVLGDLFETGTRLPDGPVPMLARGKSVFTLALRRKAGETGQLQLAGWPRSLLTALSRGPPPHQAAGEPNP
jgi:hypothetical protein